MKKMKMHSPNLTQENIDYIRKRFPGCVAEARGTYGKLKLSVDFDQLRQELSESIVEGAQERYHLDWPGKQESPTKPPIPKSPRRYAPAGKKASTLVLPRTCLSKATTWKC